VAQQAQGVAGGSMNTMDYADLARKWAKAIAYAKVGKAKDASQWAQALVDTLRANGLTIN
jgi:hypothetical protein